MTPQPRTNPNPPRPTREQLRNVLSVAIGNRETVEPRPMSTYEPLAWLLRDDVGNIAVRGARRSLYRKLVNDLAREFDLIYSERLVSSNGPWDFSDVYEASEQARHCIRRMRWCSFLHMLHIPTAGIGSVEAFESVQRLLSYPSGRSE